MKSETPTIANVMYGSMTTAGYQWPEQWTSNNSGQWIGPVHPPTQKDFDIEQMVRDLQIQKPARKTPSHEDEDEEETMAKDDTATRRLVKVVIVDPDENVPLDKCLIFSSDEQLTDKTDEELFFEIDIHNRLKSHNAERVKLLNKKVKSRKENLEPARIRDLRMTVVTIAAF